MIELEFDSELEAKGAAGIIDGIIMQPDTWGGVNAVGNKVICQNISEELIQSAQNSKGWKVLKANGVKLELLSMLNKVDDIVLNSKDGHESNMVDGLVMQIENLLAELKS
jgi:hypothetical protein